MNKLARLISDGYGAFSTLVSPIQSGRGEVAEICDIRCLSPDLRIIPPCSFNDIPEWCREKIQQKYGLPIRPGKPRTGRSSRTGYTVAPWGEATITRAADARWGEQGEEAHIKPITWT